MPFVTKPDRFSSDAIVPGRTVDPDGWVTEHTTIEGINGPVILYFSVGGLRLLAERYHQVGLVPATDLELAREHIAATEALLAQAVAALDEAEAKLGRISGLHRDGFKVQKVMGRPTTKEKV